MFENPILLLKLAGGLSPAALPGNWKRQDLIQRKDYMHK